jgi:hypothetical protein
MAKSEKQKKKFLVEISFVERRQFLGTVLVEAEDSEAARLQVCEDSDKFKQAIRYTNPAVLVSPPWTRDLGIGEFAIRKVTPLRNRAGQRKTGR